MKIEWVTPKPTRSFIPKLKKRASEKTLELAKAVWLGAVERSPVASGEFRASWNISQGVPNYNTVGSPDSSPGSSGASLPPPTMPNIEVAPLRNARYFVSNGKEYAGYIEYGSITLPPRLVLQRSIEAAVR